MNRRFMLKQLGAFGALAATSRFALAQSSGDGRFVTIASRAAPDTAGTIEVLEFFHYGCPHCKRFEPLVHEWSKTLADDVVMRRVPAIWGNPQLRELARLYFSIETAGLVEKLHEGIFVAVQDKRLPLHTEDGVRKWLDGQDVDVTEFMNTYKSFGLQAMLQRADQLARTFQINGVPSLAIGGKYVTSASLAGSHEAALKTADELIVRSRGELGA